MTTSRRLARMLGTQRGELSNDGLLVFTRVLKETKEEFPAFEIELKSQSALMRVIDVLLRVITLGRMSHFMDDYVTTIGYVVYVDNGWEGRDYLARAATIRHEAVHMRQTNRMGFLLFAITYLLLPLPIGLAAGRRNLEMEAYEETLRAYVDYYGPSVLSLKSLRDSITEQFTGPSYFWMWPFKKSVNAWYDRVIATIEQERAGG